MQSVPTREVTDSKEAAERTARVLAKTLYRELRQNGLEERQVLAVTTELLALVARDLRDSRPQAAGTVSAG
jgi:hypothetical protein